MTLLKLPQLGELQEDVVAVHRRDDESGQAVADASARDVVAQEGEGRMRREIERARPSPRFVHLAGGVGRVAIDRLEMIGNVTIREVLELAAELAGRAAHVDRLVHVASGPPRRRAPVET